MLETTAAILPCRDFDETAAFYAKIGFRETGRWGDYGYMIIAMDMVEVHFFGNPELDPGKNESGAYIRSSDVDGLSNRIASLGLPDEGRPSFGPAEDKDWGMREMPLVDPNGNLIRIGQFVNHG